MPVSTSRITFGVSASDPNAEKVSYSSFSSTSSANPPTNKLAPTSMVRRSWLAGEHLMGLPKSFTMFITSLAYSASSSDRNSTKANPWCEVVTYGQKVKNKTQRFEMLGMKLKVLIKP
jgi:hypothetical protein